MKILFGVIAIFCLVLAASGCVNQGSGNITNETRNVTSFNQINSNGDMELILTQGNNNSVVVQGDTSLISNIGTSVTNNQLIISNSNYNMGSKPVKVYITVVDLNAVQIGGSGSITGTDMKLKNLDLFVSGSGSINMVNIIAESLKVSNSGSGSITMSGNVQNQDVIISSSGRYNSRDMQSNNANVEIDGSGTAIVNVLNQLNILINGSGQVSYIGNPNIQQQVIGSGTVKKVG